MRFDFLNLPYLKKVNARAFTSCELAYYPEYLGNKSLAFSGKDSNIRASLGLGFNIPLNEMISIGLYYNCANFGTKPGDIERTSFFNFVF